MVMFTNRRQEKVAVGSVAFVAMAMLLVWGCRDSDTSLAKPDEASALLISDSAESPDAVVAQANVRWVPASLSEEIAPGTTKTVDVSFRVNRKIKGVVDVKIEPTGQSVSVSASPSSFANVSENMSIPITLTMAAASTSTPAMTDFTISLVRRGWETPLQGILGLNVQVMTSDWSSSVSPTTGVYVEYPTFGLDSQVNEIETAPGYHAINIDLATGSGGAFVTQIGFIIIDNPNQLPIDEWFAINIDVTGTLLATGAFTPVSFSNGLEGFFIAGPLPSEHIDLVGPVDMAYMTSSTRNKVIVATLSQVHDLESFGLGHAEQADLIRAMIDRLIVP